MNPFSHFIQQNLTNKKWMAFLMEGHPFFCIDLKGQPEIGLNLKSKWTGN